MDYLHRAGQQAVECSAYAEAVSRLTTAVDLLAPLPETRERRQQELAVQMTLDMALRATKGQVAPEVERLYTRARALCEQVGEPQQLFRVLWGLWRVFNSRGEYRTMLALGEQLLSLAQGLNNPDLLLEAHHSLWTSLFTGGELTAARAHQEEGLRLYDPQRGGVRDLDFSIATSRLGDTLQPPTSRTGTLPVHAPALLGHRPMSTWPIVGASLDEGLKARE